jgi:hypothetical protein
VPFHREECFKRYHSLKHLLGALVFHKNFVHKSN